MNLPKIALKILESSYPKIWREVDAVRALRGNTLPKWPDWCFLPSRFYPLIPSMNITEKLERIKLMDTSGMPDDIMQELSSEQYNLNMHIRMLGPFSSWRATQGIYVFDSTIAEELVKTPMKGIVPIEAFTRIPEWGVYVDLSSCSYEVREILRKTHNRSIDGFFAHLDWKGDSDPVLYFVTIERSTGLPAGKAGVSVHFCDVQLGKTVEQTIRNYGEDYGIDADQVQFAYMLISLLLYICQVNGLERDIIDTSGVEYTPAKPKPTKTRKGPRMFPPKSPRIWHCGSRQGPHLRRAREKMATKHESSGLKRGSPRPHYRSAHWRWQAYGIGSRKNHALRRHELRWIHPILVNLNKTLPDNGLIPATRDVE
ncbi:hypothetical protein ACFL2Q_00115 [Thermodesulfobacteriota bacterium]